MSLFFKARYEFDTEYVQISLLRRCNLRDSCVSLKLHVSYACK